VVFSDRVESCGQKGIKLMREFEKPITTVDVALFTLRNRTLSVLLAARDKPPFAGMLALPGGFIHDEEDGDTEQTARRVLRQKIGLVVPYLEQLYPFSGRRRDPRGWSVSVAYYALVPEQMIAASPTV